ncbi:MAG: hypothetical protein NTW55_06580 [Planctomycetota bacterium]|nr:hypothetical protein [Planctomycetota bacterium]
MTKDSKIISVHKQKDNTRVFLSLAILLNLNKYISETNHINGKFINIKFVPDPPGITNNHKNNGIAIKV